MIYLWVSPKSPEANFPRRNSSHRIDNDSYKRFLVSLIRHLRTYVDSGKPTTVTRMTVVPTDSIFFSFYLQIIIQNVLEAVTTTYTGKQIMHCIICHVVYEKLQLFHC